MKAARKHKQFGITTLESLMAIAITLVSLGSAVPGFDEMRQRRHLDGTAAQLETDLQYARSTAVSQHRTIRLRFMLTEGGSCYVVHSGAAGDCRCSATGESSCSAGAVAVRSVGFPQGAPVSLNSNAASMIFEPVKGTVTPTSTMRVESGGRAVHVVTNIMGRVRTCSPDGKVAGHSPC
jgi:type IV fimbrial biogenesis protein FimT